jgi:hypothetical protein
MKENSQAESDWPEFIPGNTYPWEEIRDYTWSPDRGSRYVPEGTLFVYRKEPDAFLGQFDELEDENPFALVPAEDAQNAVLELLQHGLGLRDVARRAGVSLEAAERATAGHGHVRRATQEALERLAASLSENGNGKVLSR